MNYKQLTVNNEKIKNIKNRLIACKICSNHTNNDIIYAKEMTFGTRQIFQYLFCFKCNSLSIAEIPDNINNYYKNYPSVKPINLDSSFYKHFFKSYILSHNNLLSRLLCKFLPSYDDLRTNALHPYKFSKNSKILDVGCGSGTFVYELKKLGYKNCIGIDPLVEKEIPFLVQKKEFFEIEDTFDLITFHHSFEHLSNIYEIMHKIDCSLNPNGSCIIRMPNIESYSFKKFKSAWEGIHAPFHLILPSLKGMKLLLQNTNLEIVEIRGEQLTELFLNSINQKLDIAHSEKNSVRNFLGNTPLKRKIPPFFTKNEIKYWKEKTKHFLKTSPLLCDYIVYYLKKK